MKSITVRFTDQEASEIENRASRANVTVSDYIRGTLRDAPTLRTLAQMIGNQSKQIGTGNNEEIYGALKEIQSIIFKNSLTLNEYIKKTVSDKVLDQIRDGVLTSLDKKSN